MDRVYLASRRVANGDEHPGLEGEYAEDESLSGEEAHRGVPQADGIEAQGEGLEGPGAGIRLHHEEDSGRGISRKPEETLPVGDFIQA